MPRRRAKDIRRKELRRNENETPDDSDYDDVAIDDICQPVLRTVEYDGPWHCVYEKQPGEDGRIVLDFIMKRKIRPVEKVKAAIEIP